MTSSILSFVLVLGILIFFHELGHFLVARGFGVGVERFSLGFGPRVVGKTVGITDYRISAIPLGGYVKMVGEDPDAEIDPASIPFSFTHQHVLKRICIVAAGPLFNILLAVIIFFGIYLFSGLYVLEPVIGTVSPDSPAASAGIQPGDRVLGINGQAVDRWEDMAELISGSRGRPLEVRIERDGRQLSVSLIPELKPATNLFGETIDRYLIGVSAAGEVSSRQLGPLEAAYHAVGQTYTITRLTVVSVVKLIQGTVSVKTIGGPIKIAEMAGQQAREGMLNLLFFTALISINLAILNFLPIPVLDGGHLLFFFIELFRGRPVSIRIREVAQQAGMFILLMLMMFVIYNDISQLFSS